MKKAYNFAHSRAALSEIAYRAGGSGPAQLRCARLRALKILCVVVLLPALLFTGCGRESQPPAESTGTTSGNGAGDDLPDFTLGANESDDSDGDVDGDTPASGTSNNGGTNPSATGSGSSGGNAGDNVFANIPKELRGTTVTFAQWGDEGAAEYVKVAKQFTKETNINVKWVTYTQTEYVASVVKQIAAKAGPDVVILGNNFPLALEMTQPLPAAFNLNDGFWDKRVSQALSAKGKYYFVNSYRSPYIGGSMIYYNKKIFNDNGLNTPQDYYDQGKWTYENLTKCMREVHRLNKGYVGGIIDPLVIAEQMNSSLVMYDDATGTFKGNAKDNNIVSALQYGAKCVEEGITRGGTTVGGFTSGQVGICMIGTYGLKYNGYFRDMSPSEIGVVPLPTSFEGKTLKYMPMMTRGYGIANGAKNMDGAYYFLRYFLDLDNYAKAGANVFANKVMEKYYMETHLTMTKTADLFFERYSDPLKLVGALWSGPAWAHVRTASSGQIAVELDKMQNVCNDAAKAANEKIAALK